MTNSLMRSEDPSMDGNRLSGVLEFLQDAERLKDTLRSGTTRLGRPESTAEHSWRLALMILLFEKDLQNIDILQLLKLALIHDLGEAISGDVPAPLQSEDDNRQARERRDFQTLSTPLPEDISQELLDLWDEYATAASPEAQLAKGFDKLETMLQHLLMPQQDPAFYEFNLSYGNVHTGRHQLTRHIREIVDAGTRKKLREAESQSS